MRIHHRSPQSLTCFLFYNQHISTWKGEALFSTFFKQQILIPVVRFVSETLVLVYMKVYSLHTM